MPGSALVLLWMLHRKWLATENALNIQQRQLQICADLVSQEAQRVSQGLLL